MRDQYNNTKPDPMFGSFYEMEQFMKLQDPRPKPKEIQHVVMDADDTIWAVEPWGIASLSTPIGQTDENILPVEMNIDEFLAIPEFWKDVRPTGYVSLMPTLRETLDKLEGKGISVSIASNNDKRKVLEYLEAFGLKDKFVDVEAEWGVSKGTMVNNIAKRQNIDTDKILFVDDSFMNGRDVSNMTKATPVIMGHHIAQLSDIMEFIK